MKSTIMHYLVLFYSALLSLVVTSISIPQITDNFVDYYEMSAKKISSVMKPIRLRLALNILAFILCLFVIYYLLKHVKSFQYKMIHIGLFAFITFNHFINIIFYSMILNFNNVNTRIFVVFNILSVICAFSVYILELFKFLRNKI